MAEKGLQVVVRFPDAIPHAVQGRTLLWLEMTLRTMTNQDVRVVKDLKGDDSKLRVMMTVQQREKL
jgi:hypothetical protein